MTQRRQHSFSGLEIILVAVIIVIIGLTGYFVYHATKAANKTLASAAKVAESSPSVTKKTAPADETHPDSQGSGLTGAGATQLVQTAYSSYLTAVKAGFSSGNAQEDLPTIKSDLTDTLYQNLLTQHDDGADHDVVLCAQALPGSVTAVLDSSSNDFAAVNVQEKFGTDTVNIPVTVDLSAQKIATITCPQAQ